MLFAATFDPFGPFGAKPMSEAPFNPVAPALANAVRDATGVRFTALPLRRDTRLPSSSTPSPARAPLIPSPLTPAPPRSPHQEE